MSTEQTGTLNKDIIGCKNNVYAKKGERVKIISIHHLPVLIVENDKERFPVNECDLELDKK
jgi:hypothetical protein